MPNYVREQEVDRGERCLATEGGRGDAQRPTCHLLCLQAQKKKQNTGAGSGVVHTTPDYDDDDESNLKTQLSE